MLKAARAVQKKVQEEERNRKSGGGGGSGHTRTFCMYAFFDGFGCGITNAILVLQSLSHFRGKVQFSQPKKVFQRRSESRIT